MMRFKAFAIVLAVLPFPSFFLPITEAQKPACVHEWSYQFFKENFRVLPVKCTGVEEEKEDGRGTGVYKFYWEFVGDPHQVPIGSFELYPDVIILNLKGDKVSFRHFLDDHSHFYLVCYCNRCLTALRLDQMKSEGENYASK